MTGNPYPMEADPKKYPLWRRISARLGIPTLVYWDKSDHFKAPMPIYLGWCGRHRIYFLDYPHGYRGYLSCPRCLELWLNLVRGGAGGEE